MFSSILKIAIGSYVSLDVDRLSIVSSSLSLEAQSEPFVQGVLPKAPVLICPSPRHLALERMHVIIKP